MAADATEKSLAHALAGEPTSGSDQAGGRISPDHALEQASKMAPLEPEFGPQFAALWTPEPSNIPQCAAYRSKADLLLYGGAAGGGKTDLLLGLALNEHSCSVIFRRTYGDLATAERRLIEILGSREGYHGTDMVLSRPGCVIEFGALDRPGSEHQWQGRPHDFIGFDECALLDESKVRLVMAWLRSTDPEQRCRVVIASNPPAGGEGEWLLAWFAPWLDPAFPNPAAPGELRWRCMRKDGTIAWVNGPGTHLIDGLELQALSCTFIPARLSDNRHLRDTNYRAQLMGLPEPMRSKLLNGDFLSGREDGANQVIPSAWIEAAQARWKPEGGRDAKLTTIGVDVAQGGAADTVLARLHGTWFAPLIKRRGIDTTNGPAVAALVIEHRHDGAQVNIDLTGGWGGSAFDHLVAQGIRTEPVVFSAGSCERTRDGQLTFANLRAQMLWKLREALDPLYGDGIALPPDKRLAAQLAAPRWRLRGSAIAIESKEDIYKRIGASTDDADAVMLAWHLRDQALRRQGKSRLNPARGLAHGGWMGV
jgi:Terminase large subunit, T4likevirus-type, N-terminal